MDPKKTIKRIQRFGEVIERMEVEKSHIEKSLLDWIYAERKEVVDYYNRATYDQFRRYFAERAPEYARLKAEVERLFVRIIATETFGDPHTEYLYIPIEHILDPDQVRREVEAREAQQAAMEAVKKQAREEAEKKLFEELKAKYGP